RRSSVRPLAVGAGLHGVAHEHDAAGGAGDRSLEEEEATLGGALDDLEVERGDPGVAVLAGHAHPPEDARRRRAGADRARGPVLLVVPMAGALAGEVVALHHAGEPLALADAGDVDPVAGLEHVGGEQLTDLEPGEVVDPELGEVLGRRDVGGGQVPELGLVEAGRLRVAERELDGGVAVTLGCLQLHDATGPGLEHRHPHDPVLGVPDPCHAELAPENALAGHDVGPSVVSVLYSASREWLPRPGPAERLGCAAWFCASGAQPAQTSVGEDFRSSIAAGSTPPTRRKPRDTSGYPRFRRSRAAAQTCWILISMSTPAGRSRRWSDSTVFEVGSTMSRRRLWMRISKCSRESLSTCGDRITVKRRISVGSGTGPWTFAWVRRTVSTIFFVDWSMISWS